MTEVALRNIWTAPYLESSLLEITKQTICKLNTLHNTLLTNSGHPYFNLLHSYLVILECLSQSDSQISKILVTTELVGF